MAKLSGCGRQNLALFIALLLNILPDNLIVFRPNCLNSSCCIIPASPRKGRCSFVMGATLDGSIMHMMKDTAYFPQPRDMALVVMLLVVDIIVLLGRVLVINVLLFAWK